MGLLVFLEGILSIDNALVLALLARHLPKEQQKKALTYGLFGAVFFRLIALAFATYLMKWRWVKFVGGGYLLWISIQHLFFSKQDENSPQAKKAGFWKTVFIIELTDIAFAVDSILAAVALSNKFWVVFTGGFIGVILMRFAASVFLKILDRFPNFETAAYLLVLIIGSKLILEGLKLPWIDFHSSAHPAFWIFWGLMLCGITYGFRPKRIHAKRIEE